VHLRAGLADIGLLAVDLLPCPDIGLVALPLVQPLEPDRAGFRGTDGLLQLEMP